MCVSKDGEAVEMRLERVGESCWEVSNRGGGTLCCMNSSMLGTNVASRACSSLLFIASACSRINLSNLASSGGMCRIGSNVARSSSEDIERITFHTVVGSTRNVNSMSVTGEDNDEDDMPWDVDVGVDDSVDVD